MSNMECLVCATVRDPKQLVTLDCSHIHCRACLYRDLSMSLASTPFRPVRCCSNEPIRPALLRDLIGTEHVLWNRVARDYPRVADLQSYRQRLAEYQTQDRLYCHSPRCRTFIPATLRTPRHGKCAKCSAKTCKSCQGKSHFGPCPSAEAAPKETKTKELSAQSDALFLSLAKRVGWRRCPQCRSFVEKTEGCNHIM